MTFTDMEIEESRRAKGIPADWEWHECAADCGDIVWVAPGVIGGVVKPVCSAKCALALTSSLRSDE